MQSRTRNPYTLGQFAGVCGIMLTLSCVIVWLAFGRRAQIIEILDHGVLTQATSGNQYHGKTSGTRYQFVAAGATYNGTNPNLYPPGTAVQVRYVPENPKNNAESGTISRTNADRLMWGSLAIGPVYCGIAGIIFWVKRRKPS